MGRIKQLSSAVLSGIIIGVAGIVYLIVGGVIGTFLFGLGLFVILTLKLNLFTGKVGYLVEQKPAYLIDLSVIWIGNLIGTTLSALALRSTRIGNNQDVAEKVNKIVDTKMNDSVLSILILAFFCGLLMYIAVDTYKNIENPVAQMVVIFLPIMVFILSGFEHVIANMFYFTMAWRWSVKALLYLAVMTVGNALGAMLIPLYKKMDALK